MKASIVAEDEGRAGAAPVGLSRLVAPLLVVSLLAASLLAVGCGYRQERPGLPAGARSLGLAPVNNLTGFGELDVRLHALLKRRFSGHANIRLRNPGKSDLELRIDLTGFKTTRVLDPAVGSDRVFGYSLRGSLTLIDARNGKELISRYSLAASVRRYHAGTVVETTAIRDEGIAGVLKAFADLVERRVLLVF
ncbi:MAG: hypothetical protein V3S64_14310 [bacterium]